MTIPATTENITEAELALVNEAREKEEQRQLELAATPAFAFLANTYGFSCLNRMQLPNFTDFLEVTGITENTYIIYPVIEKILYSTFDIIGQVAKNTTHEQFEATVGTIQAFVAAHTPTP